MPTRIESIDVEYNFTDVEHILDAIIEELGIHIHVRLDGSVEIFNKDGEPLVTWKTAGK